MTTPITLAYTDTWDGYHGAKNSTYTSVHKLYYNHTRAGFPAPTISSKFAGVKSITLVADTPLMNDNTETSRVRAKLK